MSLKSITKILAIVSALNICAASAWSAERTGQTDDEICEAISDNELLAEIRERNEADEERVERAAIRDRRSSAIRAD